MQIRSISAYGGEMRSLDVSLSAGLGRGAAGPLAWRAERRRGQEPAAHSAPLTVSYFAECTLPA